MGLLLSLNKIGSQQEIDAVTAEKTAVDIIKRFFDIVRKQSDKKIFIIIDEYDHFANELLAFPTSGISMGHKPEEFNNIFGSRGFVRKFYEEIKYGTQRGIVDRVFITGVTPIALGSLSSGFNIAANISNKNVMNEMTGFTVDEVKEIVKELTKCCKEADSEKLYQDLKTYYKGYLFNVEAKQRMFNPNMVFYFAGRYTEELRGEYPKNLIDHNIISDYTKIQQMFRIGDYQNSVKLATNSNPNRK